MLSLPLWSSLEHISTLQVHTCMAGVSVAILTNIIAMCGSLPELMLALHLMVALGGFD